MHTADDFIDAAIELFATGGARAVTMAAVARSVGAPSGSIYHRFESRGALVGSLWQRTTSEFEAEYKVVIGARPGPDAAIAAAVWMVDWCRGNVGKAAVLNAGPGAFNPQTWPPATLAAHQAARQALFNDAATLIEAVSDLAGVQRDEAAFAMFGLPIAVVGDHLRQQIPVPASASELVRRLATRILRAENQTKQNSAH